MYNTIISAAELAAILNEENCRVIDCRYDLMDLNAGRSQYEESHINGALFADVHDDLSGPPVTDHGRHPLPDEASLITLFSRLGIGSNTQVVVYDAAGGAFAARLWWLLRYMGHDAVALLDGGWPAWQAAGYETASGQEKSEQTDFSGKAKTEWLVTLDNIHDAQQLIDSRDPARYRGEIEPIDRIGGHIPGALNHFWKNNLSEDGCFKSSEVLRQQFLSLTPVNTEDVVFYCGSGVTACHNLLAGAHAGLAPSRLYAGSWSEWCADENRPVVTGESAE